MTADSSSDSRELPPVDLLILGLGDLDRGLELDMEGDNFSSMDSLRGCIGEGWDGSAVAGEEGELVTMDTGVIKVEGLLRVTAGVTHLVEADLGMGNTRVCCVLISGLGVSSDTASPAFVGTMVVEALEADGEASSSSSWKSNTSSLDLRISASVSLTGEVSTDFGTSIFLTSFSGGLTSSLRFSSVDDLRISAAMFSIDSSSCLSSSVTAAACSFSTFFT